MTRKPDKLQEFLDRLRKIRQDIDIQEAIDRDLERLFGPELNEIEIPIEALPGLMVKEAQKIFRTQELIERGHKLMRDIKESRNK